MRLVRRFLAEEPSLSAESLNTDFITIAKPNNTVRPELLSILCMAKQRLMITG